MRLLLPRAALLVTLTLALTAATVTFAAYVRDSTSSSEHLRNLRNDTERLRDTLRSQRNTPSPRSSGESVSSFLDRAAADNRARDAARQQAREKASLDAKWNRDHPNETRFQYYSRLENERAAADYAASAAGVAAARAAKARAVQAEYAALAARSSAASWEKYRTENHNFIPRSRAPSTSNRRRKGRSANTVAGASSAAAQPVSAFNAAEKSARTRKCVCVSAAAATAGRSSAKPRSGTRRAVGMDIMAEGGRGRETGSEIAESHPRGHFLPFTLRGLHAGKWKR